MQTKKSFLALESTFLRFRQNKKKIRHQNFGKFLLKLFFEQMTFLPRAFLLHSEKRFLALESLFLRFCQIKKIVT